MPRISTPEAPSTVRHPLPRTALLTAVCVAVLLLGLSASLYKIHFPPGPVADEAAYLMITQSLWHDHDLSYDGRDLERAYRVWDQGPKGLILFTDDGGRTMFYGKPFVYSLAALPFYVVLGPQGLMVFNMALYLAMAGAAWWFFAGRRRPVGLLLAGFFFASTSFIYVFWLQPEVFEMATVFFALLAWQWVRERDSVGRRELVVLAAAGALLAAAYVAREPLAVFALPVAVDLLWRRRARAAAAFVAAGLVAAALLVGFQWKLTGHPSPYRGVQRSSFPLPGETQFPGQADRDFWRLYKGTTFGSWSGTRVETRPRILLRDVEYFLVGRHTGLVPYFPFALFAFALYLRGPRDRSRHLLLAAAAAYCIALFLLRPHNFHGGAGFLGNRYFAAIYPALLFLPGRLRGGWGLVAPYAAAGLWTAAVLAVPVQQVAPEFGLQVHTRMPAFQALPLELTLLPGGRIPGYAMRPWPGGVWVVPRQDFFPEEHHPNGVWVRGAARAEVWVVSPQPISSLGFWVYSPLPDNVLTLKSAGRHLVVPFDTAANRDGRRIDLPLEASARDLGFFSDQPHEYFYRFTLETRLGWLPAHADPEGSQDFRYLSVFLSWNGKPP